MTVGELVAALRMLPQDLPVMYDRDGGFDDVDGIYVAEAVRMKIPLGLHGRFRYVVQNLSDRRLYPPGHAMLKYTEVEGDPFQVVVLGGVDPQDLAQWDSEAVHP